MAKSIPLRMVPLRVPQVGLRAFQDELMAVKLDFLLWGWNWKTRKLVLPADSSADTVRAAVTRNSPSSEEDVSAEVLGRSTDLPAPKARVPSEEAHRPSSHRGRHATTARMPAMERCLPSEQVPFVDLLSSQGPSVQGGAFGSRDFGSNTFGAETRGASCSGRRQGWGDTCAFGTSAFGGAPLAVAVRAGVAGLPVADSPTPLKVLA
ncbi:hypothetical protein AXG93_242s1510 [Marchantia polymorpha subsp. ruderalis]|uniref:Uncharacterized protein n=1 Tax=Marchantia polymorpha subsp. ruderalis TaxID=1480154 RepID=A0A176VQ37_MARPO|nr:hypothetical protein AXG93_242s1510 [Marchantia polymorpha subsp. ruderalis]